MPTPDPNMRLSNAERETLIGLLHAATEEGRLDLDEFAERSRRVYEARTYAEVESLLADLPSEGGALAVPAPARPVDDLVLTPSYSKLVRDGEWEVPARITVKPQYTRIKLDARFAHFNAQEVEVVLDLAYSSFEMVLPRGATAVNDNVQQEGGQVVIRCPARGDGPRIRLEGRVTYGRVKIRYERRFLWWRW